MTDPIPRPDDELVSAVLDGEATPDERALVEADPAARRRLAELRRVRDLVAAPVPVAGSVREAAIAAALAQFDGAAGPTGGADPHPAAPTDRFVVPDQLATRRARRQGGNGARILAAVAAIVVLVIGTSVVLRILNPPADVTVASTAQSAEIPAPDVAAGGSGSSGAAEADRQDENAVTSTTVTLDADAMDTTLPATTAAPDDATTSTIETVELGPVASNRDLRDRVLTIVDQQATREQADPRSTGPEVSRRPALDALVSCASYLDAIDPELDQLLAVANATYGGQPTAVFAFRIDRAAYPAANGSVRIYAVDPVTCTTRTVLTVR